MTAPRRGRGQTLARLVRYDVLSHQRLGRWLLLPAPALLCALLVARDLERQNIDWTLGDLIGAVMTVPLLTGLVLGIPILLLTVDLPLRQLDAGEATLTFTRVGSRPLWWASKLVSVAVVAFAASLACVALVVAFGALRSTSLSLVPGEALATLLELGFVTTPTSRQVLVAASPVLLTLAVLPTAVLAATVGVAARGLGPAGLVAGFGMLSAPFVPLFAELPGWVLAPVPGASVLVPHAVVDSQLSATAFLLASLGWFVATIVVGPRTIEDLR